MSDTLEGIDYAEKQGEDLINLSLGVPDVIELLNQQKWGVLRDSVWK